MDLTQIAEEIQKCRDLWDHRSLFRIYGVYGCKLEDLDEVEEYLTEGKKPNSSVAKRIVQELR